MKRSPATSHLLAAAVLVSALGVGLWAGTASAALISIDHYDINDAVESGHGNWSHTYNGTITAGVGFDNFSNPGTTATYFGGSGTLNDGVIGTSTSDTQLFVTPSASDGTAIDPVIFLTLDFTTGGPWLVSSIEIYGGDISNNYIPGAITGLDVGIIGPTGGAPDTPFTTTSFAGSVQNEAGGDVNDRVNLTGSGLELMPERGLRLAFRDFRELSTTGFPSPKSRFMGSKLRPPAAFLSPHHSPLSASVLPGWHSRVVVTWLSESRKACRRAASPTGCAGARHRAPCRAAPSSRSCSGIRSPQAPGRG